MGFGVFLTMWFGAPAIGQELKIKNASSWELEGRIQLQYLINTDIEGDASRTNNGFRIRRGRLQVSGKLTDFVETKFQIDARDNSPRLKDAEGTLRFANGLYLRFGQYKVPVWREELRSSSKLLMVERSHVAAFLGDFNLSVRHVGMEFGRRTENGVDFAVNLSNGAGEGGHEEAGRSKSDFVNNGKLLTGRINFPVGKTFQIAVSGAMNRVGNKIGTADNAATISVIAPDFGLYLDSGDRGKIEIEGGFAFGSIGKDFTGDTDDTDFTLFDATGRYTHKFEKVAEDYAGMDTIEFAAGFSRLDVNEDVLNVFRFGPAFYFGKQTRLQVNGEIESPDEGDSIFRIRSQITFNF
jgi:hypothetical protein